MLQAHSCVSAGCDQCGDGHELGYQPHWDSEATALADLAAAGWQVGDGAPPRLLCPTCAAVLACEAAGHDFTDWQRCRCARQVSKHPPGPGGACGMQFRYCRRCWLHESRPALTGAPTPTAVAS